jgi:hypothetical protein
LRFEKKVEKMKEENDVKMEERKRKRGNGDFKRKQRGNGENTGEENFSLTPRPSLK